MRVNDVFSMRIVRTLQKRPHIRMSMGAMKLVEEYGAWFIQFPTFSYIRVQGFSTEPYKLPRYPTDKMVLLELTRQLTAYDKIQKGKKKLGLQFPISIGEGKTEVCSCIKAAERSLEELHFFRLPLYPRRNDFDPYNKISLAGG